MTNLFAQVFAVEHAIPWSETGSCEVRQKEMTSFGVRIEKCKSLRVEVASEFDWQEIYE